MELFEQGMFAIDPNSTPEMLMRKRERIRAMSSNFGNARYTGQGLAQLAQGVVAGIQGRKMNRLEGDKTSEASDLFSRVMGQRRQAPAPAESGFNLFGGPDAAANVQAPASEAETIGDTTMATLGLPSNNGNPSVMGSFMDSDNPLRQGIIETAEAIGANPLDLATAISYETAGTFSPTQAGPTTQWGQHRGLIQFGEPQAQQYGVDWDNPLSSQLGPDGAVARYFRENGYQPGMSGLDLYSTINAGAPGLYNRSDANNGGAPGTVADKWNNQMSGHRDAAMRLLGGDFTPSSGQRSSPSPVNTASFGGPDMASLVELAQNPWLSVEQRSIVNSMMGQAQQAQANANDPLRQLQIQQAQLQIDQARNPQMSPLEQVQLEQAQFNLEQSRNQPPPAAGAPTTRTIFDQDTGREQTVQWNGSEWVPLGGVEAPSGPMVTVENNMPGDDKFAEAFASGDASALASISESGIAAQRNIGRINQLGELLSASPTGFTGAAALKAGEWGINTEGLSDLQAAQALINSLVPEQRQPGSGPMSDADLALFKQSLPRIINQPGGNEEIMQTMLGVAEYDAQGAQIVQSLRAGEIDRATAFQRLQSRQNPFDTVRAAAPDEPAPRIAPEDSDNLDFSNMSALELSRVDVMTLTAEQMDAMERRFEELKF